jgi:PAS domain S-box-containing protein
MNPHGPGLDQTRNDLARQRAALRDAEAALEASEERFRLLAEGVRDYAIIMLDSQGHVRRWNSGAQAISGYQADEVLGKSFVCFYNIADADRGKPDLDLSVAASSGRLEEEGWRRRKDGSHYWAHELITALRDHSGALSGFALVTQDVSERKRSEQILIEHRALDRSNRELEQFAYVASHDLQEPLRKIQAFGDRLRAKCGGSLGPEGHDYLERMLKSAERMQKLINDLLTFSRLTTRAQPFARVNLAEVVREVLSDLESRAEKEHGRVAVNELPVIQAEPLQMRQLFQNLLSNALKFHRPDVPPVVQIQSRMLPAPDLVEANAGAPAFCEVTIQDNGIGFDEKYLSRIFTVFQRLHGRTEYEGTGIGLAVCRRIVEWHNGGITAKSKPGRGSKFIITLPVRQPEPENKV